jgi:acyl-CoA reductase-like NAD-dependent aldehyde dehydrogenase
VLTHGGLHDVGGFYHAGQVCVSVQRVFAPHRVAERLAERLAAAAAALAVGDPSLLTTDVGPLISAHEASRVGAWVREAERDGARIITGGRALAATLYAPTILLNPPEDARSVPPLAPMRAKAHADGSP